MWIPSQENAPEGKVSIEKDHIIYLGGFPYFTKINFIKEYLEEVAVATDIYVNLFRNTAIELIYRFTIAK